MGEDMVATQLVLPAGHTLRPIDLGAIAGCGHDRVQVSRKPRVAVIPTGTELVQVGQDVKPGEIIEYNSIVLASQVKAWGGRDSQPGDHSGAKPRPRLAQRWVIRRLRRFFRPCS